MQQAASTGSAPSEATTKLTRALLACFVFARRFGTLKQRGWAVYSVVTGVLFFAALAGIALGSKGPTTVTFAIGVVIGWAWISALAARLLSEHPAAKG